MTDNTDSRLRDAIANALGPRGITDSHAPTTYAIESAEDFVRVLENLLQYDASLIMDLGWQQVKIPFEGDQLGRGLALYSPRAWR